MKRIGFTSDIHLDVNTGYLNAQDLYHAAKDLLLDSLIIAGDISNGSSYIPNLINTLKKLI
jgi:Icc-related predicted phosphoesterase